jgi:hypothetical protein
MRTSVAYRYNSLEDFLISNPLELDGFLSDGWGALFPAKGRELDAAILFIDISGFSWRTADLTPFETLIFVNNFFAWITARGLRHRPGIVDKYIGDEMMVVFAREFGSEDPFLDAVQTACAMTEHDAHSYQPHIGIAVGRVAVGYVGTPLKYNCSVFGQPVALAARCAGIKSIIGRPRVIFPATDWKDRTIENTIPLERVQMPGEPVIEQPCPWELQPPRIEQIKNMPDLEVRELTYMPMHLPTVSAEERAKRSFKDLKKDGFFRSRQFKPENLPKVKVPETKSPS